MSRKEINIFSVSFLDLLSGALGAVIILYIIMPRVTAKDENALETIKELNVKVSAIDSMMSELDNSVNKAVLTNLQKTIKQTKAKIAVLKEEVKKLKGRIKELEAKSKSLNKQVKQLKRKVRELEAEIRQKNKEIEKLKQENEALKKYKVWMNDCGLSVKDDCPPEATTDIGFKFKGKKVVFVVDMSWSMMKESNQKEEGVYPVKAALKMITAVMGTDFSVDIVQYPYDPENSQASCENYRSHWGEVRVLNSQNKHSLFNFLYGLNANGGTPSKQALTHVLNSYPDITDIVFMSDGSPSISCANTEDENIESILKAVRNNNTRDVRINTIGIGSDFFDNPDSDKVQLMKKLAAQNDNGFFIGL